MTTYYKTETEALSHFGSPAHFYHFVNGILTIALVDGCPNPRPYLLLRENEGVYWQEPDA